MTKWQEISTAPKDGTHILLALRKKVHTGINWSGKRVVSGYFHTQGHDWVLEGNWASKIKPTHWMPLPEPPK